MGFRAYNSKGVDKNRAKCNMVFGRITQKGVDKNGAKCNMEFGRTTKNTRGSTRRETRPHGGAADQHLRNQGIPLAATYICQGIPLGRMETHVLQSISGRKCTTQMMPRIVTREPLNMVAATLGCRTRTMCTTSAQIDQKET